MEYVIEIKTPYIGNTPITLSKQISLSGNALEAHNVLRYTLVNVIDFIVQFQDKYPAIFDLIYKNPNGIFGGLYDILYYGENSTLKNEFLNVILNILFKGAGDLFQEINAVCKWGGYSSYVCEEEVLPYNSNNLKSDGNGNTLRMFIANDQPSGCRFAFLLLNGHPEFINEYAFGGYMGTKKTLIVSRKDITGDFKYRICLPNQSFGRTIRRSYGGKKSKKIWRGYSRI